MKRYEEILAKEIRNGQRIALYCYGIYAVHTLCRLKKYMMYCRPLSLITMSGNGERQSLTFR